MSRFRRWVEDRLPWYDREQEQAAIERTEEIRRHSIRTRKSAESLDSYRRVRLPR